MLVLGCATYDRDRKLQMSLGHPVRHTGDPFVEREIEIVGNLDHLKKDEIPIPSILNIMTGHCRHEPDIIGVEVHGAVLPTLEKDDD